MGGIGRWNQPAQRPGPPRGCLLWGPHAAGSGGSLQPPSSRARADPEMCCFPFPEAAVAVRGLGQPSWVRACALWFRPPLPPHPASNPSHSEEAPCLTVNAGPSAPWQWRARGQPCPVPGKPAAGVAGGSQCPEAGGWPQYGLFREKRQLKGGDNNC